MRLDNHPITGKPLKNAPEWWFRDEYVGKDND